MAPTPDSVLLEVRAGNVIVTGAGDPARLRFPAHINVSINGELQHNRDCMVHPRAAISVDGLHTPARCEYRVEVDADSMTARMRIVQEHGRTRTLRDCEPTSDLTLVCDEQLHDPPAPDTAAALLAIHEHGVTFGVDREAVEAAIADPGTEHVIARGVPAEQGTNGYLRALCDFEAVEFTGVPAGTPLLQIVPRVEGRPGTTVAGKQLPVRATRDARLRLGAGVARDAGDTVVEATCDGQPRWDGDSSIEVREELFLPLVGPGTGNIDFCGSVRIEGDIGAGRSVRARGKLTVGGNVDRARLESGRSMWVDGTIMSSVLRAGGQRAVAAGVFDKIEDVPERLADAATRARELRDAAERRGQELSHGLSLQLILERLHRPTLTSIKEVAEELRESGPEAHEDAARVSEWHRALSTAAVNSLGSDGFMQILDGLSRMVDDIRHALENGSDLHVSYMQASEAEATGVVTLTGKGIFNSRVVAWGGLHADKADAVVRGGSLTAHGPVTVHELGSPSGARMQVLLGSGAALDSDLVYSGTVISGPGHAHRFLSDRSHVQIRLDGHDMDVASLAA